MEDEFKRKGIHIFNGFWVILLPFFDRFIAVGLVLLAFGFVFLLARPNSKIHPVFSKAFESMARPEDRQKGFLVGPTIYVVMVLILVLFFDFRVAGAIFAILAFGDGFATVIGIKFGSHKLYHNKSLEGTIAFFAFSLVSGVTIFVLINQFNTPGAGLILVPFLILPAIASINVEEIFTIFTILSLILALVELYLGDFINDNYLIPIVGSTILFMLLQFMFTIQPQG